MSRIECRFALLRFWISAFRPRTLVLTFSGWLVGSVLAFCNGPFERKIALLTLTTAFLLQMLSNLANDYGDASSGVDSEKRKGPSRMVQLGKISAKTMKNAIVLFSLLSFLSGCLLLYVALDNAIVYTVFFLLMGVLSIFAAIKYTVGKNPYGYAGFGDLFVFLFFGIILVAGSFFLQTKSLDLFVLLPACSIGLFSVGVLNVNNVRDIESDRASGKKSIPVRIGRKKAGTYHLFLLCGGLASSVVYVYLAFQSLIQGIFLLVIFLLIKNWMAVRSKEATQLDPYVGQMAQSTLFFALLFSVGAIATCWTF